MRNSLGLFYLPPYPLFTPSTLAIPPPSLFFRFRSPVCVNDKPSLVVQKFHLHFIPGPPPLLSLNPQPLHALHPGLFLPFHPLSSHYQSSHPPPATPLPHPL